MDNENTNVNTTTNGGSADVVETTTTATATQQATQQTQQQEQPAGRTYTQEQLDAIIDRAQKRATKGMFTKEQMDAKDSSIAALTTERDAANADKAKLQEQLDALTHEKFLGTKGVPEDMREFYAYKIGKLMTEGKTFEQAAEEYIKDHPPAGTVRMSTGGGVSKSGGTPPKNTNDKMNALIRGVR